MVCGFCFFGFGNYSVGFDSEKLRGVRGAVVAQGNIVF